MEIIPVVSPDTLHILANEERGYVEKNRLWHFSSLILPIQEGSRNVLIQTRPHGKTYEGRLDIFGGYVHKSNLTEILFKDFSQKCLSIIFADTAIRESNEEINLIINKKMKQISADDLVLLEPLGGYIANNDVIREISSVYILIVPKEASINTRDEVDGVEVSTKSEYLEFEKLLFIHKMNPNQLSSALGRVLEKYSTEEKVALQLEKYLGSKNNGVN